GDLDEDLASFGGTLAAEWKLDGVRIQLHKAGDVVKVFTRSLNDVTAMAPWIVSIGKALPVSTAILDGEAVAYGADGRVLPFQDLWSRFTRNLGPFTIAFFDALLIDEPIVTLPNRERWSRLGKIIAGDMLIKRTIATSSD